LACAVDAKTKFFAVFTMVIKLLTFPLFGVVALTINWIKLVKAVLELAYAAASFIYTYFI